MLVEALICEEPMPIFGEVRTAGSEKPTRWDFRTSAMAAHLKIQGSVYFAFTAQVEVTYKLKVCECRPFLFAQI